MRSELILRVVAKGLIPFILLFAFYTQAHGEVSPGGGFQAGVIAAAAFVLYGLVYGLEMVERVLPTAVARGLAAAGVLVYSGTGILTWLLGGQFLDYNRLAHDPTHGQHYGIIAVEVGVVLTVFGVMVILFYGFAGRGREE